MSLSSPLSPRQLDILRWIADGCPPREWSDHTYKTTALSLQNRRLVAVSKKDGWSAVIEPAGRYYLDHGVYPDDHFSAKKHRRLPSPRTTPIPKPAVPGPPAVSPPELVERLLVDGRIELASPTQAERAAWRRAIHAALGSGLIPDGKYLRHTGRDRGPLAIYLDDQPPIPTPRRPVPVPTEVDEQNPAVRLLLAEPPRLGVSEQARPRALRIMQALATETLRRGYQLELHPDGSPGFQLQRHGYTQRYVLGEEEDKVDEYPADEVASAKYSWQRVSARTVTVPSGRLILHYDQKWGVRRWADRTRWTLDDKLPEILDDFERQAQDNLDRTLAHEAEEQRLARLWRTARTDARRQLTLAHNRARVLSQLDDLDHARRLRAYAQDLEELLDRCKNPGTASEIRGWQLFVSTEADRLDPLRHVELQRWDEPDATDDDLDPYMPSDMDAAYPPTPRSRFR
ncbi:hypothetical protein C8K36_108223 [Rhodococcus sp. OK519]|uniref:hypothetical protein n=1 Tax=Rhodococcus sp. OK519 TaxID=2135729 RepID=UPI000D3A43CC|nr:hypothetical protein C8K36_108223 [Rhodococcus sp. OK519]